MFEYGTAVEAYTAAIALDPTVGAWGGARGLHSSTSQLNLSRFDHTSPCHHV
jgi:hypothetical protein